VQEEIGRLRDAVDILTKRKTCKRRYVRVEGTLTVSKASNIITAKEDNNYKDSKTPTKRVVRAERRCGRCSEIGHNSRTCKVEIEDRDSSTASE
jgi:hypothetical protein